MRFIRRDVGGPGVGIQQDQETNPSLEWKSGMVAALENDPGSLANMNSTYILIRGWGFGG